MPQTPYNQPIGLAYKRISTQTTTTVKATAGYLDRIILNSATTGAVVTLYDNPAAGSGTVIASWVVTSGVNTPAPAIVYNIIFTNGLTIVTATANADITVVYK
jgi:hypothetical protein